MVLAPANHLVAVVLLGKQAQGRLNHTTAQPGKCKFQGLSKVFFSPANPNPYMTPLTNNFSGVQCTNFTDYLIKKEFDAPT